MKRICKYTIFLVSLFLVVSFQTTFAATSKLPYICVDSPTNNSLVNKSVDIVGWAINTSGIKQVNIFIDNKKQGMATIGLARPDVDRVYPGYKGGGQSGYRYLLYTSTLAGGTHSIKIQAVGNDGIIREGTVNIKITKLSPLMIIDSPKQNQKVDASTQIVGWAINTSGIKNVDVYVDGQFKSKATVGLSRPDVDKVYPGYSGGNSSGFNYNLDSNSIGGGNHQVMVKATGNDGAVTESQVAISKPVVNIPASLLYIDTPINNEMARKQIEIKGWTLSPSGVKQVNILVNNKQVGTATVGLSRPDVAKACVGYVGAGNSGYVYSLNTASFAKGVNTVKVQTIGNDGTIKEAIVNINVENLVPMINIDTPIQNQKINGDTEIKGWALDASGVKKVDAYIDGQLVSTTNVGLSRPDVNSVYPGYPGGGTSGFKCNLSINSYGSGSHQLLLRATGNDGETIERQVTINKLAPLICIDTPQSNDITKNIVQVTGWALNASGVKKVNIYVDGTTKLVGSATIGLSRPDVAKAYPLYMNGAVSGYTYNMDMSQLVSGKHSIFIQAIGNDNQVQQISVSVTKGTDKFLSTNYSVSLDTFINQELANTPAAYIGGQWRYAVIKNGQLGYSLDNGSAWVNSPTTYNNIKSQLIFNINPLNTENDPTKIYQFANLNYADCVTAATLDSMFSVNGSLKGKGQIFINAARAYNVNPVYLAAHAILETGNGTSLLATGGTKNSDGKYTYGVPVYNFFGIGAVDTNVNPGGTLTAYVKGWTSIDLAIYGGASWISNGYIGGAQNTLYSMRWNPLNIHHQYATDVNWALSQTTAIKRCFDIFPNNVVTFNIPVFK